MPLPRTPEFDCTRAFFREGYEFIGNRCDRLGSELFATRLMLRPVVCMRGDEAARRFYDGRRFTRAGAMPPTTLRLLQDKRSVQSLSGDAHRRRKAMFLGLLTGDAVQQIGRLFDKRWRAAAAGWRGGRPVVLHDEMQRLLCDVACAWAGAPVAGDTLRRRTAEMAAMIDEAGTVGPRAWCGLLLRRSTERWARAAIAQARLTRPRGEATPVQRIAHHREDGELLDLRTAGVELINLIRPTVAIARYVAFAALALDRHAEAAAWLREDVDARTAAFVEEVRRFYPFFPVIGGRVREAFRWAGHDFETGDWSLLGLHATNHHTTIWGDPQAFRPKRFTGRTSDGYDLVPQGAGDHATDHRCPGEWFTTDLTRRALIQLLGLSYTLPAQPLDIPLDRFPTLPRSGVIIAVR